MVSRSWRHQAVAICLLAATAVTVVLADVVAHRFTDRADSPQRTVVAWLAAIAAGDGAAACWLMTDAGQADLHAGSVASCRETVSEMRSELSADEPPLLSAVLVRRIVVHAENAAVAVADIRASDGSAVGVLGAFSGVQLMRLSGAWRIAGLPPAAPLGGRPAHT
jgi:hypothetical protein